MAFICVVIYSFFFFFKQKTAYEMRISDWSSDVCSSDLRGEPDRRTEIPLTNFRGIELRDFPAEIARLALIIAEYQCDVLYRGQIGRASCRARVCQYV